MRKTLFLGVVLLFFALPSSWSQTNTVVDSLFELVRTSTDDSLKSRTYIKLSRIKRRSSLDSAFVLQEKAHTLAHKLQDLHLIGHSLATLATLHIETDHYVKAFEALDSATICFESVGNQEDVMYVYNIFSILYKAIGLAEAALNYNEKCLDFYRQNIDKNPNYPQYITNTLNNIGTIYQDILEDNEKAKNYFIASLNLRREIKSARLGSALNNLARAYFKLEVYDSALYYIHQVIAERKKYKEEALLIGSLLHLGIIKKQAQEPDSAFLYLQEALAMTQKQTDKRHTSKIYEILGELYYEKGNLTQAYYHQNQSLKLFKELAVAEAAESIRKLKIQKEISNYEVTKELLITQNSTNSLKIKQQEQFIIFVSVLVFLLLLLTIFMFFYYRKQRENSRKLQKLNEQILEQSRLILEKSEDLEQINHRFEVLNQNLQKEVMERSKQLAKHAFVNSHKLRAPVARILGLAQIIKGSTDSQEKEFILEQVIQNAHEVNRITTEINRNLAEDQSQLYTDANPFKGV
ncbi:MAG: tetratricopeptide repeat protein [Bernardetiaceae bacterium]|nr:tetratricopeptide repeat protein [Bernardetiaceae bacterium]